MNRDGKRTFGSWDSDWLETAEVDEDEWLYRVLVVDGDPSFVGLF